MSKFDGSRARLIRTTAILCGVGLWLFATLWVFGQSVSAGAQQNSKFERYPTSREVSGIVVDAITGRPIAGAVVSTVMPKNWHRPGRSPRGRPLPSSIGAGTTSREVPGPEEQQTTDATGHFRFAAMQFEAHKTFFVSKPGYLAPNSSGSSLSFVGASVMPGMGELRFTLNPEAEVSGKVTSNLGAALANLLVTLYRVQYTAGRPHWIYVNEQRTDGNGGYRFEELPAGRYYAVSQWLLDNDPLPFDTTHCNDNGFLPEGGFAPEAEPGVLDFQKATPILVTEGQHAVADLKLQHQVFHPVTVPVDAKLNPGLIEILDRNGRALDIPVSPTVNCGRLLRPFGDRMKKTINLPDGFYMFEQRAAYALNDPFKTGGAKQPIFLDGYAPVTVAGKPVTVTVPATLREDAPPALLVRIHHETLTSEASSKDVCTAQRGMIGGSMPPGMKPPPQFQVGLVPADGMGFDGIAVRETQKDHESYELTGLRPGRFWVETHGLRGEYVSAITSKGIDLMRNSLEIGTDLASAPIDITVRNDCGRLHFEKPWPKPASGAVLADAVGIVDPYFELLVPQFVGAAPHGRWTEERTLVEIGRAWSVTLGDLPPGPYKIFQSFDEQAVDFFTPAELEKRLGPGRDVWLKPGEQTNLDLHDPQL